MKIKKQYIIAHRGASGLVEHENTIEAFEKAIEVGADYIEMDLRKTSDNKIIVVHNPDYNGKLIKDFSYQELCQETLENGFIMPLFENVLEKFKDKIMFDIELTEEGYEEEIVEMVLKYLSLDSFIIKSFFKKSVRKIKKINKKITTALLLGVEFPKYGYLTRIAELFPLGKIITSKCDIVSPNYQLVICGFVRRMKLIKKPVWVWTVNDNEKMDVLLNKNKVDAIITNYPDRALKFRKQ